MPPPLCVLAAALVGTLAEGVFLAAGRALGIIMGLMLWGAKAVCYAAPAPIPRRMSLGPASETSAVTISTAIPCQASTMAAASR